MPNYRSLIGGYFSDTSNHSLPASIRYNNAGAINGGTWERGYPGYVNTIVTTPGNATTIFEAPEYGVAAWSELMHKYAAAGVTTLGGIINRYGGGQDYSDYVAFVTGKTAFSANKVIDLNDDAVLLPFAKAMFQYEAGRPTPLSDDQIKFGFAVARNGGRVPSQPLPASPPPPVPASRWSWIGALLAALFARPRQTPAPAVPKPSPRDLNLADRIVTAMRAKGYQVDTGPGQVNIVYVEGMNPDGSKNDHVSNHFDDVRTVVTFDAGGHPVLAGSWEGTTEPGKYWTEHRMNPKGAARIALGQFRAWQVGNYHDAPALIQSAPITVFRDDAEDYKRDGLQDTGMFGIEQHGGYNYPHDDLGRSSAGCLVGRTVDGHAAFMRLVKADPRYLADPNYQFLTAVLPASDVP